MRQIWIIRFSDGTVGSCYGTREEAIELEGDERMIERLKHWIFKSRKKHCRCCCLTCKYFEECKNRTVR